MGSEYTFVDSSAMQEGISYLRNGKTEMDNHLQELKSAIGQGFEQWTGSAREAYTQEQEKWNQSGNRMTEIINKISVVLTQIAQGYNDTERKVGSMWA